MTGTQRGPQVVNKKFHNFNASTNKDLTTFRDAADASTVRFDVERKESPRYVFSSRNKMETTAVSTSHNTREVLKQTTSIFNDTDQDLRSVREDSKSRTASHINLAMLETVSTST